MNNSTGNFTAPEASVNYIHKPGILEIFVFSFNFVFGLPAHSYMIWLIFTGSGIASEFFRLNLSVCETGNCLACLLFILNTWISSLGMYENFLQGLIVTGRPLFQCLICVERYLAVVHPVTFLKFKPLRYKVICSIVAWIVILVSCLSCRFITALLNYINLLWFLSVQFLLFLFFQMFCCLAVLGALKQSGPGERGREREEENHKKKKAFHLILIITVTTVITYVPYILSGFFSIMMGHIIYECWITGLICYALAGFVHPLLYLRRVGKLFCL